MGWISMPAFTPNATIMQERARNMTLKPRAVHPSGSNSPNLSPKDSAKYCIDQPPTML